MQISRPAFLRAFQTLRAKRCNHHFSCQWFPLKSFCPCFFSTALFSCQNTIEAATDAGMWLECWANSSKFSSVLFRGFRECFKTWHVSSKGLTPLEKELSLCQKCVSPLAEALWTVNKIRWEARRALLPQHKLFIGCFIAVHFWMLSELTA